MHMTTSLRVIALFDEMSDADLARVSEGCTTSTYRKNAEILSENDRTSDVFFILAGAVRINSISAKGREVIYLAMKLTQVPRTVLSALVGEAGDLALTAATAAVPSRLVPNPVTRGV